MIEACEAACATGLRQVRLGNCGVFARSAEQQETLVNRLGTDRIG
jgi:hypothetical protein